jgi:hypothetical protein
MEDTKIRKIVGALLISGAIAVNIPYTLLIMTFDYPDILRAPTGDILTRFADGGSGLIWTWLAFAWVGLPILIGILVLPRALGVDQPGSRGQTTSKLATVFGVSGAAVQIVGLLRWAFVVPLLAKTYTTPQATEATREAVAAVFLAVHQYGGVILGEHIGQAFTIIWMILLSVSLLRQGLLPRWVSWAGFLASGVYALAQGELLATVVQDFPYWGEAGFVGSMMWLGWLIVLGIILVRPIRSIQYENAGQNPELGFGALQ